MRTVSIGDTHGLAVAELVSQIAGEYDKIIFMGDYVDSYFVSNSEVSQNLLDIIDLKKRYPSRMVLLWGNHDIQYLLGAKNFGCSGYRLEMWEALHGLFSSNEDLFQFSFGIANYLWTHAGINQYWYDNRFKPVTEKSDNPGSLPEQLNEAFRRRDKAIFDVGYKRGGFFEAGGPFWCDIAELIRDPIRGYHQIVGHNRVREIRTLTVYGNEISFIDQLESLNIIDLSSFFYKKIDL